jgi:mannitol-1-phosphate 5-dehydrogenase
MPAKHLVLFGAGMTGRGQVAQLAHESGWRLTLIDRDPAVIARLRCAGSYTVHLLSESGARDVTISGYHALHTWETDAVAAAVAGADLLVTSVLEPNLAEVAETLAPALAARLATSDRPLNILAAENMMNSSEVLAGYVLPRFTRAQRTAAATLLGFPNSMIARVVPVAQDSLFIPAEEFSEWTADATTAVGELPQIRGLEWVTNQAARLQRKLFIHNTGHAVCGYAGWLAGYRYIHEAAQDPAIMARITSAISESGAAVAAEHGFDLASIRAYEDNLKSRLVIDALPDDIRRVIRQPLRKLGPQERLVGPTLLCEQHALPCAGLCWGIAAVLASSMPGDDQFERLAATVHHLGPVPALADLVGYHPSPASAALISQAYAELIP